MVSNPNRFPATDTATLIVPSSGGISAVNKALGFVARGVIIDNLTNQWLLLREPFIFVGPYVSGKQVPIRGAQTVTVVAQAPPTFAQGPLIPNQVAIITFTETPVPASPGVPSSSTSITILATVGVDSPAAGWTATDTNTGAHYSVANASLFVSSWSLRGDSTAVQASIFITIRGVTSGNIFHISNLQFGPPAAGVVAVVAGGTNYIPAIQVKNLLVNDNLFDIGVDSEALATNVRVRGLLGMIA